MSEKQKQQQQQKTMFNMNITVMWHSNKSMNKCNWLSVESYSKGVRIMFSPFFSVFTKGGSGFCSLEAKRRRYKLNQSKGNRDFISSCLVQSTCNTSWKGILPSKKRAFYTAPDICWLCMMGFLVQCIWGILFRNNLPQAKKSSK